MWSAFIVHEARTLNLFLLYAFSVRPKNSKSNSKSLRSTLMFSSKSCMILAVLFKLLIHSEFISVYGVKLVCMWKSSYANTSGLRVYDWFLHWMVLASLSKFNWPCIYGFISGLSAILLVHKQSILMPGSCFFHY